MLFRSKLRRLNEVIEVKKKQAAIRNQADIGKTFRVLVEKPSKRSDKDMSGRNDQNKLIVFPAENIKPGTYVNVKVIRTSQATLIGELV